MSEGKRRQYISVDYESLRLITECCEPGKAASIRSLWVAMERLAWEQRRKHHGRAFVTSQALLANVAGISVPTVQRCSAFLEDIELLTVTARYKERNRRDFNHYALKYAPSKYHNDVLETDLHTSPNPNLQDVVLLQKGVASKCPPLTLRHFDASHIKDKEAAMAAKREAAAKYKAEQLAVAEQRRRQEEAELAERKERERIEREERLERLRLAEEKQKADKEAAKLVEDARRLAMRTEVGSCMAAIRQAVFDEYDPGTLPGVLADFDRSTFYAAVGRLQPELSNKVSAVMKRCPWDF